MYGIEPIFVLNSALLGDLKLRKHDKTIYDFCGSILQRYAPSMKLYIGTMFPRCLHNSLSLTSLQWQPN